METADGGTNGRSKCNVPQENKDIRHFLDTVSLPVAGLVMGSS